MNNQEILKIQEASQQHLITLNNVIETLKVENKELRIKSDTWDRISDTTDVIEMSAVAKMLDFPKIGRNKMFAILRDNLILRYNNEPLQEYINKNYFKVIENEIDTDFYNGISQKTMVTQKGIDFIKTIIKEHLGE